jgi:hypothetical protein
MIPCQRHLFDIPDDVAYLNCAYMSPLMKPALEAGTAWPGPQSASLGNHARQIFYRRGRVSRRPPRS